MFYINFESFKLTMDLKLLIVVVLISTLILFFHFLVYYHNQLKESAFGYEVCSLPVRVRAQWHSGRGGDGIINFFVNGDGN